MAGTARSDILESMISTLGPAMTVESTATDAELSLTDAADRLGVHYVTAYRYVRQGLLPARQDGRRWLVEAAAVDSFASATPGERPDGPLPVESLRELMEAGDEDGAWELVTACGGLADPLAVQQQLIAPALREVGRRWSVGEATIAQEHRATVVATRLIARIGCPTRRGRRRGTVVVACPPSDHHALATALFANLVRSEGAEVIDLGRIAGSSTILERLSRIDGPVAVAIVATMSDHESEVRSLVDEIKAAARPSSVVVGGLAVPDPETAERLGSDHYFASVDMAAAGLALIARS